MGKSLRSGERPRLEAEKTTGSIIRGNGHRKRKLISDHFFEGRPQEPHAMKHDEWLDISASPGPSRRLRVRIAGEGKPLLLLHGYPLDSQMWGPLIERLQNQFLCIAPDLRGFGESGEERFSFELEDLAKDSQSIVHRIAPGVAPILCGLSMGGYIAMRYMAIFGDQVDRVVLTNTRGNADDAEAQKNRRVTATNALREGTEPTVAPMLQKLLSARSASTRPDLVEQVRKMMFSTRPSTVAWALQAMANRPDSMEEFSRWKCPVLCIAGQEDSITPPEALQSIASRIAGAKCSIDPHSAHLTPLESPEWFAEQLVAFSSGEET